MILLVSACETFDELRRVIVDESYALQWDALGLRSTHIQGIHCAGPPCTDFSAMGVGRGINGATMLPFLTWTKMLRTSRPLGIIFENVTRFPLLLLHSLLGDLYEIHQTVLDPTSFGWSIRRKRRYCLLTLRRATQLTRPISDLLGVLGLDSDPWSGDSLFWQHGEPEALAGSYARNAAGYVQKYGDMHGIYDLAQSPTGRPRAAIRGAACMTLTTNCRHLWNPTE